MTTLVIDTTNDKVEEALLSPNSLIQQYRFDDIQEQQVYRDSCQQMLQDISNVNHLVQDLKDTNDIYYPSTSTTLNIIKVDHVELLNEKLSNCIQHLNNLTTRVSDTSSKVLVTGDLNSGKSTLVNALLKQEILPVDQQPCTSIFCEVLSTNNEQDNNTTIVHAIKDVSNYDEMNESTYHQIELRHLYNLLTEEEQHYKMLKIYSPRDNKITKESLLYNGITNISLIDSPGLNTDSIKTTAIFAREEEIDVIVFVVSAENHFTLSGKEFLWNTANEKTQIFIVVNRFDNIRDKERCKRLILEQIKELSPSTFQKSNDLVHFVSAGQQVDSPDFIKMEQKLRSFVLHNRIESKLLPAKNYLSNLLRDLYFISTVNESKSQELHDNLLNNLENDILPGYSNLINIDNNLQQELQQLKDDSMDTIEKNARNSLLEFNSDKCIKSIQYPGLFLSWQYAQDIVDSLSTKLHDELNSIEIKAGKEIINCLNQMNNTTCDKLNQDITTKVNNDLIKYSTNHHSIHIHVQARDFLINRKFIDDKKIALSGLATISATTIFFKAINLKNIALNMISRYLNPLEESTIVSRKSIIYTLTTVGILGIGYTAYSFISVIPQAIQINLNQKFQNAVKDQKLIQTQTHRIIETAEHVLEAKKTEILYRLNQVITEKQQEKLTLEESIFESKTRLNQFKNLVSKSDALLIKVQQSLTVTS